MAAWTDWLKPRDLVPAAILPAAAAVPPPEPGTLWTAEVGGEQIVRSADRAYRSDPELDPLIAGTHDVAPLDPDRVREEILLTPPAPPPALHTRGWTPHRSVARHPEPLCVGTWRLAGLWLCM